MNPTPEEIEESFCELMEQFDKGWLVIQLPRDADPMECYDRGRRFYRCLEIYRWLKKHRSP
jgi:hypothetical protein